MNGTTLADVAVNGTETLYIQIQQLRAENQNLKTENELLKVLLGE